MQVLRILLLVMTSGVLAFFLYQAITRQISREAFWTVIAIACGFSLNLIYLSFSKPYGPPVTIEDVIEKAPGVDKANYVLPALTPYASPSHGTPGSGTANFGASA